eukprot:TRINITY_DN969_c0_g1_i3.p1 TRINITY_DN969_c0_g1~~TRINITY_DN969_c0_g1_i3.p1  ORF type:complete len:252 (+),score=57.38 TRINITY_DN969_c0_g1_i3:79-834(+)
MDFFHKHKTQIVTSVACLSAGFLIPKILSRLFYQRSRPSFKEEQILNYVFSKATQNNPDSVLAAIDEFGWKHWSMSLGDVKAKLIAELMSKSLSEGPCVAVELGAYCGYSAIFLARHLPAGSRVLSLEIDPLHAAIATKIIEFAGLSDMVKVLVGAASEILPVLPTKHGIDHIDLLLIDHLKNLYVSDMKVVESLNLLRPGAVVIADNIIQPGAPEYKAYMESHQGFTSQLHMSHAQYSSNIDAVMLSIKN